MEIPVNSNSQDLFSLDTIENNGKKVNELNVLYNALNASRFQMYQIYNIALMHTCAYTHTYLSEIDFIL